MRLNIFQRDGGLIGESFDKLLVLRHELSILFVEDLENADDLSPEIAERNAEDITCLKAGRGINRWVEEGRFVDIFNDQCSARNENRSSYSQAGVESNRIGNADGEFGPQFSLCLVQ